METRLKGGGKINELGEMSIEPSKYGGCIPKTRRGKNYFFSIISEIADFITMIDRLWDCPEDFSNPEPGGGVQCGS